MHKRIKENAPRGHYLVDFGRGNPHNSSCRLRVTEANQAERRKGGNQRMKLVKFSGKIESAYGKAVSPALSYDAEFEAFENFAEVTAAKAELSEKQQIDVLNNQSKANARQKAMQAALDAAGIVKPDVKTDPQLRLRRMYDLFVANGSTEDEAKQEASNALNIAWED